MKDLVDKSKKRNIFEVIEDFQNGGDGEAPLLWHKKPHKHESGDFACVRGLYEGCVNPINCEHCYTDKTGGYCLLKGGDSVGGFLAVEYKHEKFVEEGRSGAYGSLKDALEDLQKSTL